jgi:hypothetical protein
MIGTPVGTFDSRTIPIDLRRATPTEARALKSLESGGPEESHFLEMGRKAAQWMQDGTIGRTNRRPGPLAIPLRTSENWRPSVAG